MKIRSTLTLLEKPCNRTEQRLSDVMEVYFVKHWERRKQSTSVKTFHKKGVWVVVVCFLVRSKFLRCGLSKKKKEKKNPADEEAQGRVH